ncbi:MAG: hypothetical protein QXD77_03165, partial [Candidatus Aenigmatarchaeota archaeon]
MIDLDENYLEGRQSEEIIFGNNIALITTEFIDKKVEYYVNKLKERNFIPYILYKEGENLFVGNTIKTISFNSFVKCFDNFIDKMVVALFFMQEDFFPLLY